MFASPYGSTRTFENIINQLAKQSCFIILTMAKLLKKNVQPIDIVLQIACTLCLTYTDILQT